MAEKAILFDTTKCIGCRACQVACKQWWELPAESTKNQGTYENPPDLSAQTWNKLKFKEIGYNGTVGWLFSRQACMQCTQATCVWVCPTFARGYHELGFVTIDQNRCVGCGRCREYCPFQVPKLGLLGVSQRIQVQSEFERFVAYGCIFCRDRVEAGVSPACAKTCPPEALQFGERADLIEQGHSRIASLAATNRKAYLYGENELGGLRVMYILTEQPGFYGFPEKPEIGEYPLATDVVFPAWYVKAVSDGSLPVFPSNAKREWYLQPDLVPGKGPPEPAWPAEKSVASPGWAAPALWSWLGVGVVGGVALLWSVRRRNAQEEQNQVSGKGGGLR